MEHDTYVALHLPLPDGTTRPVSRTVTVTHPRPDAARMRAVAAAKRLARADAVGGNTRGAVYVAVQRDGSGPAVELYRSDRDTELAAFAKGFPIAKNRPYLKRPTP